jgi:MFS transporter, FHS family, glucose/mannose:H+ symporter
MRSEKLVFISACIGILLFGITLITLGSVAPWIRTKFDLDPQAFGGLFSILPFGIFTGTLLFGPFADRYGYKVIFLLSCISMFVGFEGIAFASSLAVLKFCIFFFGLGGGAMNGATNALVSDISSGNKGANLSLLGVFFAVGALGMPVVLGMLEKEFSVADIVSSVGYFAILSGVMFLVPSFPVPKLKEGISVIRLRQLLKDKLVLGVGLFLFCQSGFEAIINNWTTTYFLKIPDVSTKESLFALSLFVGGMAVMRLLHGSVLRKLSATVILTVSFTMLFAGCGLLHFSASYLQSVTGLILLGAGLAVGFPVMLGLIGERYAHVSATAFGVVISIALAGNMLINYLTGIVVGAHGVEHLITIAVVITSIMVFLSLIILENIKHKHF